jgi:hypothetical protein
MTELLRYLSPDAIARHQLQSLFLNTSCADSVDIAPPV